MSLVQAYSSAQLVWANDSTELNNDDLKSFFDVVKSNTQNGAEALNYSFSCTDTESQSPNNKELQEVTSGNKVDNSDASEPVVVCDNGAAKEVNNSDVSEPVVVLNNGAAKEVNNSDASEPVVVFDSGATKEVDNDVNDLDVGEPLIVFDSGAAKEVDNDVNDLDVNEPVVVFDSGANLEVDNGVNNSDVIEPVVVFDNGAAKEVNNDVNDSDVSEQVMVSSLGADSLLEEAVIIADYLSALETWSEEVVTIMQNCPDDLKSLSWELLDSEQKARIHELKCEFETSITKVETLEEISNTTSNTDSAHNLKVGDTVVWNNCYPHLQSWQPFTICKIQGDEAKLDYCANYVPLEELSLVD